MRYLIILGLVFILSGCCTLCPEFNKIVRERKLIDKYRQEQLNYYRDVVCKDICDKCNDTKERRDFSCEDCVMKHIHNLE